MDLIDLYKKIKAKIKNSSGSDNIESSAAAIFILLAVIIIFLIMAIILIGTILIFQAFMFLLDIDFFPIDPTSFSPLDEIIIIITIIYYYL